MFNDMPAPMVEVMRRLEARDERDRADGTAHLERLRQIPPETGRFIALLAASAPEGAMIEVGTSAGYSTMWLALACRATGRSITTFEILDHKAALARETFAEAQVTDVVTAIEGDFLQHSDDITNIAFCFLDAEKDVYEACYDVVVPRLVSGGLLVADNATSHAADLKEFIDRAMADDRVDATVATVGKGELICRKR